ncbi:MAG: beta strand repeat-containing protein, partial [Bacteroidota bacterium]
NGGTSQSTYAKGDILYASAANTLSKLTIGSEGQVLISANTGIPYWGSNGLSKLNGITVSEHTFATPTNTTTSDIGWSSSVSGAHTLNIPDASVSRRGTMSVSAQTFRGDKTFENDINANGIYIGKGTNSRSTNLAIGYAGVGLKNFNTTTSTSAINNIAIGVNTLSSLADGYSNNAVGNGALSATNGGYNNNAFGLDALKGNTGGFNNSGFGQSTLQANSTGDDNTAVGYNSLVSTTGDKNTAIGSTTNISAGKSNSTAIGYGATVSENNTIQLGNTEVTSVNTSGALTTGNITYPIAHGSNGQVLSTTGSGTLTWTTPSAGITGVGTMTTTSYAAGATVSGNSLILAPANASFGGVVSTFTQTFAGAKTFDSDVVVNGLTIGRGKSSVGTNTAMGGSALNANTSGTSNTGIGSGALQAVTTGGGNTAVGANSLSLNIASNYNTSMGFQSLYNTTGDENTGFGKGTLWDNTTGSRNTAIGFGANVGSGTLSNSTAIGAYATVSASNRIQLGSTAVTSVNTSGALTTGTVTYPIAHGSSGQVLSTTGSGTLTWTTPSAGITGVGTMTTTSYAEGAAVSGNSLILAPANASFGGVVSTFTQTFAGAKTFDSDIVVNGFTIGRGKGQTTYPNTVIGISSLNANTTGVYNIAIAPNTLNANTTGSYNSAIGSLALNKNTEGSGNIAIGYQALNNSTIKDNNTAIGYRSMLSNTEGYENTGIGKDALSANTTGFRNTAIGFEANVGSGTLSNSTVIGASATVSASNTIQLGNTSVTSVNTSGALTTGTVTYPRTHGSNGQVLSTTGSGTLTWTTPSAGITGVGTMTTTSYAAGATVSENSLILAPADASNGGVVTTGTQTFAGNKTFSGTLSTTSLTATGSISSTSVTTGTFTATSATVGSLRVTGGTLVSGRVLTSDANGNATWGAGGLTAVGSISATSNSSGATVSGTSLVLTPADASNGGVLTSGTQTIGGEKRFDKAVTNLVAFNASNGTTINFANSNLAYTSANPGNTFTLQNMKDGGTYTLAVQGTTSGTAAFSATGFTAANTISLGNYATTAGKHTLYTFVVMGSVVYYSMVSAQ